MDNPELQRILAALNNQPPPPPIATEHRDFHHLQREHPDPRQSRRQNPFIPGLGLLSSPESQERYLTPPPSRRQEPSTPQPILPPARPADVPSKPSTPTVPDASGITTWPAALKHVTRHIVPNEQVAGRIKHIISEQHKHERQWWASREAIVARQQGRSGTTQQVSALLKALGGKEVPAPPSDPKTNQAELDAFDKKVYAGLMSMASDFDRQLRTMGVPFYAIKHDLVVLEHGPENAGGAKGRLDKGELRELQKRMLQTLEDLFAE